MSEELKAIVQQHIDSYDFFVDHALESIVKTLPPAFFKNVAGSPYWRVKFSALRMGSPMKHDHIALYPNESRRSVSTYNAPLAGTISIYKDPHSDAHIDMSVTLGNAPVMVMSRKCHLHGMSPAQLVQHYEEENEVGGYFIVNGNEKVMRMLVANKANHPIALQRHGWTNRGPGYTKYGITIRCVRPDRSSMSNNLHYLSDGQITFRFYYRKQEYFIPVTLLLRALVDTTDKEIYNQIVQGDIENTFLTDRVELLLREQKINGMSRREEVLDYIGARYRLKTNHPDDYSNKEIAEYFIDQLFLVHLPDYRDKYNLLMYGLTIISPPPYLYIYIYSMMIQKLYSVVQGRSGCDNIDATSFHEVLLPGHLMAALLRDKLSEYLEVLRALFTKSISESSGKKVNHDVSLKKCIERMPSIGERLTYLLSTGNLVSESGLDVQQTTGFSIIADKLNYVRFLSHFRAIHRGAFFATMKTTSIRKLMPESFGFLCPVHTPDGAPCGLLNHLSANCIVTKDPLQQPKVLEASALLPAFLANHGVTTVESTSTFKQGALPVLVNGRLVGMIDPALAEDLVVLLRYYKSKGTEPAIPATLEVGFAPPEKTTGGQFPGLFLFTTGARFMRSVINLKSGKSEMIGPQEQLYMNIAILPEEVTDSSTHCEHSPNAMFSVEANLTPFSDYNQSPRNMYQCQMAKQTMGTPLHSYPYRTDNKLYKIQNIQKPVVRTENQEKYPYNDYPNGCNAVIAVISNTGYDMEDAMIINKSSYERGFGHGSVYKTDVVFLEEGRSRLEIGKLFVARPNFQSDNLDEFLDKDGMPHVGRLIKYGEPYYSTYSEIEKKQIVKNFKGKEDAYIEDILILGGNQSKASTIITKFLVKLRFNRNPVIGDKFSSRHGQKGVLSQLWPEINMPFTETGLKPDLIINPNAFPSRMTIGMLVEILAAKAGALHGTFQDATAFRFNEKNSAVEYFGEQLKKAGFNYYGNEPLYSGTNGEEFEANIFFGICYYQRLRHMVKDKYQVRATGVVNSLTRQPIKGRKVGGGIRFGEMERDSLLAHGTSFCLNDRLMKSSDYSKVRICKKCGQTHTVFVKKSPYSEHMATSCVACKTDEHIVTIALPHVFSLLLAELASVNISLKLSVE
uniref:DNA-directed RNA polymerase subunit beta n=1 Tax=Rostrostelium ellipticum TaxID=361140 RepID=A0A1L2FUN7_9MYCE|nr:RNA polymerase I second largest subunit [Rostrostelium ellipticum]